MKKEIAVCNCKSKKKDSFSTELINPRIVAWGYEDVAVRYTEVCTKCKAITQKHVEIDYHITNKW